MKTPHPCNHSQLSPLLRAAATLRLVFVALCFAASAHAAEQRPPNIVFILGDDLGYGDLGCFGQTRIQTPNLDRLAAEGMRLTQHYSGNAVCAPSRCVLMTGKHPGHAFIRDNRQVRKDVEGQYPIPQNTVTLPKLLKARGYSTGGFGKWGLGGPDTSGEPMKQGFDRWFGFNCQAVAHNFFPIYLWDNDKMKPLSNPAFSAHAKLPAGADPKNPASYQQYEGPEYSADLIAEEARAFVKQHKERPFFLYWPTTVPHLALQVPEDSLKQYAGLWEDEPYVGNHGYLPHFKPKAAYAAMITRMDREVGRMIDLVHELGLDEQTIFVFSSDNGPLNGTHQGLGGTDAVFFNSAGGLRDGKGSLWEGGFRVPTIVRWKGRVPAGTTSERVSGFEDWIPTLLEAAANAGVPERSAAVFDGVSLLPTLLGKTQPERPFLYREFSGYLGYQVVRMGDWKGVRVGLSKKQNAAAGGSRGGSEVQLYNLRKDPAETTNVAAEHAEIVEKMKQIMRDQHAPSGEFPFPALDAAL
jgi:arylsulfatase A-like enzyme